MDLGCGDGDVGQWLSPYGLEAFGLDRLPLGAATKLAIRGDALRPPLRPGRLDGVLAVNLVPHALAQDPSGLFLERWLDLLKPDGWLFLVGDQACGTRDPAVRNYQKLQAFLAEIVPQWRGPLVSGQQIVARLEQAGARNIRWGVEPNAGKPDTEAVLTMLAGTGNTRPAGPADRLARSIRRDGLSLGRYWWVEAQPSTGS
ncbi:hypothetical protein CSB20_07835 [bacterium DOLZORAL124_64_63]|nr:MAG: hypothetical protein CSB20_07835 [bacterium DOLZORAL124_64_63]